MEELTLSNAELAAILRKMGLALNAEPSFSRLAHEENGEYYDVWRAESGKNCCILKRAKERELEAYQTFFAHGPEYAPRLLGRAEHGGASYIAIEHISGRDLCKCDREALRTALDALIAMQKEFWGRSELESSVYTFEESAARHANRANYLLDAGLEEAFAEFLRIYNALPRTLCHDDLLPFNVIVSGKRAVIIDWECAGMQPYPSSLSRLIAHGTNDENDLFYMSDSDRAFAIQYYYDNLIAKKGIAYNEYRRALDYSLFYEYCEWVFVGNKYNATDGDYYKKYIVIARRAAKELKEKYGCV